MNLYHLRYFTTLARYEHYTRAAEELMITQPSLSHAIAAMEDELGVKLFEKEGRNVVLTRFGHIFLQDVERALAVLDGAITTMQMAGSGSGTIELGFLRTLGTEMVPQIIRGFLNQNIEKDIQFSLHTGITFDLLTDLVKRRLDIVLCSYDERFQDKVTFTPVATQELVLIVHKDHPLAEQESVNLVDTLIYPHIFFTRTSGLRQVVDGLFEKIKGEPKVVFEVEEDQVIAGLVAQNFGIAVVPNMPILKFMDVKALQITAPSWERNFYLAFMKYRYMPPVVSDLKDYITAGGLPDLV